MTSNRNHHREVYVLGQTKENKDVLITIALVNVTDITDLLRKPEKLHDASYSGGYINCGKIYKMEHLNGSEATSEAKCGDITMKLSKFFLIKNHDYSEKKGLKVFRTKTGALNSSTYVHPLYTGVRYHFHENGLLQKKIIYRNGDKIRETHYRNDTFNTVNKVYEYENNKIKIMHSYSDEEVLQRHVYHSLKSVGVVGEEASSLN